MSSSKRKRARILTASGLKKLREQIRAHEVEENAGFKYTLERLGELTGLDPETVKNVLDCKGSDRRTITRCFQIFGLTLEDSDFIPAVQAFAAPSDPNFVGRDEATNDLNTLVSRNTKVIVIQARGGVGKTTLARKYLQQEFDLFLEFPIAKETKDIASIEGLIEEKLRQLGEEPGREFLISLDRLKRKLQAEPIGILIDNLEPALDSAGRFIKAHRRYVELLRVLSDPTVKSITLITSRERLREVDITVQHYKLRSLDLKAWEQFFQSHNIQVTSLPSYGRGVRGKGALAALHNAYGGNAKAMDIINGVVLEDFSGDVEAYWQVNQDDLFIERDLEDLVTHQFDRLQQLNPDAYKLLCRLGCYRYQDVPTVLIEGLFCLLWDVPENRHRQVIKSLQDRSLVDWEEREFWLHPVIRAEAIERLKREGDWEETNREAAEYWTNIVESIETIEDAKKAFEAYYHYLEIKDNEKAGNVIIKDRQNRWSDWQEGECLGHSLYKLGLLQEANSAISLTIANINSGYPLSRLYSILGLLYRFTGNIHQAIEYHEISGRIAADVLQSTRRFEEANIDPEKLTMASLLDKGLCKIELWEIQEALEIFEEARVRIANTSFQDYKLETDYCVAFLKSLSSSDNIKRASLLVLANQTYAALEANDFGSWTKGYGLCFLGLTYKNLGIYDKASLMYCKATKYARKANYSLIKAKVLYGSAEICRICQSFTKALSRHLKSIELLDARGNKTDLAEAYYQFGLTYQAMGEVKKCNTNFQEAIQLFSEMEAPKQVERVRKAMQKNQNEK